MEKLIIESLTEENHKYLNPLIVLPSIIDFWF